MDGQDRQPEGQTARRTARQRTTDDQKSSHELLAELKTISLLFYMLSQNIFMRKDIIKVFRLFLILYYYLLIINKNNKEKETVGYQ